MMKFQTGPSSCGDGEVRLVGGESEREGSRDLLQWSMGDSV